MCVCKLDIPIEQTNFLFEQIDITSQTEIKALQDVCDYVYIDVKRQKSVAGNIPTGIPMLRSNFASRVRLQKRQKPLRAPAT